MKDFQKFMGFLLFLGYHRLPRERTYWVNADNCKIHIVTQADKDWIKFETALKLHNAIYIIRDNYHEEWE